MKNLFSSTCNSCFSLLFLHEREREREREREGGRERDLVS
jgi:hypothetical protein